MKTPALETSSEQDDTITVVVDDSGGDKESDKCGDVELMAATQRLFEPSESDDGDDGDVELAAATMRAPHVESIQDGRLAQQRAKETFIAAYPFLVLHGAQNRYCADRKFYAQVNEAAGALAGRCVVWCARVDDPTSMMCFFVLCSAESIWQSSPQDAGERDYYALRARARDAERPVCYAPAHDAQHCVLGSWRV